MTNRRWWELASAPVLALVLVLRVPLVSDGWLGADKLKHFFITAFVQSLTYSAAQAAGADRGDAMRASIAVAAGVAIGREVYDGRVKGRFSIPDLVWDAGGSLAATAMLRRTK